MSVSIGRLKEILSETIAKDFIERGYTFNKQLYQFKKKMKKNKLRCSFLFYNYTPYRVEFSYIFTGWIWEIEEEKRKFYDHYSKAYGNDISFMLDEGDFQPSVKHEISKFRSAFVHKLSDFEKDIQTIDQARALLKNEVFPFIDFFSEFKNFQIYILNNYDFVMHHGIYWSALIAAKLKGRDELQKLADFIWEKEGLEAKTDEYNTRRFIKELLAYADIGN